MHLKNGVPEQQIEFHHKGINPIQEHDWRVKSYITIQIYTLM